MNTRVPYPKAHARHFRHQCLIYSGAPSQHLDALAQTIADKLRTHHRCFYLNSAAMVAGMRSCLAANGVDLEKEITKGALILSSDQEHLANGRFDVDAMLKMLGSHVESAIADGYAGLWATGDMTWEFGSERNLDKLVEYERRLEQLMLAYPALSGVCQYHRDTLPQHAIHVAEEEHQAMYVNATLSRLNPEYRCGC